MSTRHRLIAVAVATIWGLNFLAIHASVAVLPPFFAVAVRFALIAIPTILFVPRPAVRLRYLIGYGLGFGVAQFTFLYWGMRAGMPAGTASLVLQASAPCTVILGALLVGERVGGRRWTGIAVATAGLAMVGIARATGGGVGPFLLVLAGAVGWAFGNIASRQAKPSNPLHFTLWMSVVVPVPMLALSFVVEGPGQMGAALASIARADAAPAWLGMAYTVVVGTVVGSGLWTWLLSRYPAGVVAPFSMLVPVVGMATAAIALHDVPTPLELAGAVTVVGGVLYAAGGSRPIPFSASSQDAPEKPQFRGTARRRTRELSAAPGR